MEHNRPASSKTIVKDIFQVKVSSPRTEFASSGVRQAQIFLKVTASPKLFLPIKSFRFLSAKYIKSSSYFKYNFFFLLYYTSKNFIRLGCRCALQNSWSSGLVQSSVHNVTLFIFFPLCEIHRVLHKLPKHQSSRSICILAVVSAFQVMSALLTDFSSSSPGGAPLLFLFDEQV